MNLAMIMMATMTNDNGEEYEDGGDAEY